MFGNIRTMSKDNLRGGVHRYAPCGLSKGLVTNYGEGGYKTEGGHEKFYPYEKGGRKKFPLF